MTKQDYINAISHMSQSDPEAGRRCSPMTKHPTRAELTAAIAALLDKADYRKLRLVWIYAKHLIEKEGASA